MKRFICLLAVAASVSLSATVATAAGDDWARQGPRAIAPVSSNEVVRPDDRARRGIGPAPTATVVQSPSVRVDGFTRLGIQITC
jgi:hypothetical protein